MTYFESRLQLHEMYANWWMTYANTDHNKQRNVVRADGYKLTPEDLVADAMITSKQHIKLFAELMENFHNEQ